MRLHQHSGGDSRCWGFGGQGWQPVGGGSNGGGRWCVGGRGRPKATDRAGSRSLWVVEGTAGAGPAVLLSATQPQDLVEVGFLARCLTDGAAWCRAGV